MLSLSDIFSPFSVILPTLTLMALALPTSGQKPQKVDSEAHLFTAADGSTLPYRLVEPANQEAGKTYPLVLCLHGAGGRGDDNRGRGSEAFKILSRKINREAHPAYLLMPQCPQGEQWVNTPWPRGSYSIDTIPISKRLQQVVELLKKTMAEHAVDPDRVYVSGQSMGGYGTWDLILRFPDTFAAAIPVCGAGDPTHAADIAKLPLWVFHGAQDGVVPVSGSRDMIEALNAVDSPVRYTEYPDLQHISWGRAWQEEELIPWLFSQSR